MLIRVPDYYDAFHCLAGSCPHSCCEKWEVVIDEETACRYGRVSGELGERLRNAMERDGEGDVCFPLRGGRCPFLDEENLCEIHRVLGQEATSETCREHPRFTEDYGFFREITLSASCPAANALLLGSREKLTFSERQTEEEGETADEWTEALLFVRQTLLAVLTDRSQSFAARLAEFLALAARQQREIEETLAPRGDTADALPEGVFSFLSTLEPLEEDWKELLGKAACAAPAEVPEELLERIAVYFAFRYLLKCVNDDDLWCRARFVAAAVRIVERLAAVCGLGEALRRFSCEVEHSDENLEALLTWLGEQG